MDPYNSNPSSRFTPKVIIAIAGGVLLLLIVIYLVVSQMPKGGSTAQNGTPTQAPSSDTSGILPTRTQGAESKKNNLPPGVIAQVGREYLYGADLDAAVESYGLLDNSLPKTREFMLNNMINQSVVLQAGEKAGYLKLDPIIFNSPSKDLRKRFEAYETVRLKVLDEASGVEGTYVSILFNNDGTGSTPLAEGKQIALSKMQPLFDQVKKGEITVEQAGNVIRADRTLWQLDPVYQLHALRRFREANNEAITNDPTFDAKLKALNKGQLTDLHLMKVATVDGNSVEVGYTFGTVTEKKTTSFSNFDEWIASQRKNYEIIY